MDFPEYFDIKEAIRIFKETINAIDEIVERVIEAIKHIFPILEYYCELKRLLTPHELAMAMYASKKRVRKKYYNRAIYKKLKKCK